MINLRAKGFVLFFVVMGVTLATILLTTPNDAKAKPLVWIQPYTWATWRIDASFDQANPQKIQAEWVVTLGETNKFNEDTTLDEETYTLTCNENGNVPINNGNVADFSNGAGYFECQLPDFRAAVLDLIYGTEYEFTFPPDDGDNPVTYECLPEFDKRYIAEMFGTPEEGIFNPVLVHDDVRFAIPVTNGKTQLNLFVNSVLKTNGFNLPIGNYLYRSELNCPVGGNCEGKHQVIDSMSVLEERIQGGIPHVPAHLTLTPTTVYIGYDPANGSYLNALVAHITVDPGCRCQGD